MLRCCFHLLNFFVPKHVQTKINELQSKLTLGSLFSDFFLMRISLKFCIPRRQSQLGWDCPTFHRERHTVFGKSHFNAHGQKSAMQRCIFDPCRRRIVPPYQARVVPGHATPYTCMYYMYYLHQMACYTLLAWHTLHTLHIHTHTNTLRSLHTLYALHCIHCMHYMPCCIASPVATAQDKRQHLNNIQHTAYIHASMHPCIDPNIYWSIQPNTCPYIYIYIHKNDNNTTNNNDNNNTYIYIATSTHAYVCVSLLLAWLYIYVHTYIHTYIHT